MSDQENDSLAIEVQESESVDANEGVRELKSGVADKSEQKIVCFDFDGTLTFHDSFVSFLFFGAGLMRFLSGGLVLLPYALGFKAGFISSHRAKEIALSYFFEGLSKKELRELANRFAREVVPGLLRPEGLKRIEWHRSQGHHLVLVSASLDLWLEPVARNLNMDLICTRLQYEQGVFTGKIEGTNCYGPEKERKILERYPEIDYAYGDTRGDHEMMNMAQTAYFKPFRKDNLEEERWRNR